MKTWDDLLPLVVPYLSGAPDVVIKTALSRAAADFFARSHVWREELTLDNAAPGTAEVELMPPSRAKIESVLWLVSDASQLVQTDERFVSPMVRGQQGRPHTFWVVGDTYIRLHPIPDAIYPMRALVALKPDVDSDEIADWVFDTWADALVDGAVWYLTDIPNKHWSDAARAQLHKVRFDRAIANAKTRDLRQINLRVQPRAF